MRIAKFAAFMVAIVASLAVGAQAEWNKVSPEGLERGVRKALCEQSLLYFTRCFFKARFGQKFIVNHHHKLICDELEALVDGRSYANVADTTGLT